jgi:hypothetical protein
LLPLRVVYFGILLVYATVALAICRIHVDWQVVLSTVPLVLLADGVPTFAGLGSREAMLHFVLAPGESNPTLVAMSLLWTIGMIVGRLMIATVHLWLHRARLGAAKIAPSKSPVDERATSTPAPDDDALRRTA